MSSNVLEWVQDCYHDNYKGAPEDGSEWQASCSEGNAVRTMRGGSWIPLPDRTRFAIRFRVDTSQRSDDNGFRLARMLP